MGVKNRAGQPCYIVYCFYREQDGSDESVRLFNSTEAALKHIQEGMNQINGHNREYNLFELGDEIPLQFEKKSVQPPAPPPVVTMVVSLKDTPIPDPRPTTEPRRLDKSFHATHNT